MTNESNEVSHWIDLIKDGDSIAAEQLWHTYFDRLVRSVRQKLYGQNRAVSDEEDIVLSVFDSFYEAAQQGRFPKLNDRDDLWRLLLTMSARKIIDKRRHDQRQRRGGGVTVKSLGHRDDESTLFEVIGSQPSPDMVMIMQESVEKLFFHLGDGQLQELAGYKLEGYSNAEIAVRLGCSERTIERRLHLIREKLQQELVENDHQPKKTSNRDPGKD